MSLHQSVGQNHCLTCFNRACEIEWKVCISPGIPFIWNMCLQPFLLKTNWKFHYPTPLHSGWKLVSMVSTHKAGMFSLKFRTLIQTAQDFFNFFFFFYFGMCSFSGRLWSIFKICVRDSSGKASKIMEIRIPIQIINNFKSSLYSFLVLLYCAFIRHSFYSVFWITVFRISPF